VLWPQLWFLSGMRFSEVEKVLNSTGRSTLHSLKSSKRAHAHGKRRATVLAAAATASLLTMQSAEAASATWIASPTDATWANGANWNPAAAPGNTSAGATASTDTATFTTAISGGLGSSTTPIVIDSGRTIGNITFNTSAGAYVIGANGGNTLYLSSGGAITVNTGDTSAQVVAAPITLENAAASTSGVYSFINNSTTAAANLTLSGAITGTATSGTTTTLAFGGVRPTSPTFDLASGVISDGSGGGNIGVTIGSGWGYLVLTGPAIGAGMTLGSSAADWQFSANDTFSGPLTISAGTLQITGATTTGRLVNVGNITVAGNGTLIDGSSTAANNNSVINRINSASNLTLGGTVGAGTFTAAFGATGTTSQTLATLTIGQGGNVVNTVNTAAGTNNLIFTGTGGDGYVRNANGLVNFVSATGFNPQFTNAPTAVGGSSVSGTAGSGNEILIGAVLNSSDFVQGATTGNLAAATYTANGASSLTAGANINVTGGSTTLAGSTTLSVNSLRFPDSTADALALGTGSVLTVASGGILIPGSVTANAVNDVISGGTITSGQGDLWIYSASGTNGTMANPRSGSVNGNPRSSTYATTISSVIGNNGGNTVSLTVGGDGYSQVLLSGTNTYTGGTYLENGMVVIGADSGLGANGGTVTAVSGTNSIFPTASFTFNSSRNFVVNSGALLQIGDTGQINTIAGQLSGGGELEIGFVSNGERVILTGTNSSFTGRYDVNGYLRASEGVGLSSNANLNLAGRGGNNLGILETSGSVTRSLGSGAGQVEWSSPNAGYSDGGFAAVGGALAVNLGGASTPVTLTQNSGGFLTGNSYLDLQDSQSTNTLSWANPINNNGSTLFVLEGSPNALTTDAATMTGAISGSGGLTKYVNGAGQLILTLQRYLSFRKDFSRERFAA
jgi:fibronectin-binding autotransporter adhesin